DPGGLANRVLRPPPALSRSTRLRPALARRRGAEQGRDLLQHDVGLEVHAVAWPPVAEGGLGEGMRDEGDGEAAVSTSGDGEAHAIDGDGALADDVGSERPRNLEPVGAPVALAADRRQPPDAVNGSLHGATAEQGGEPERPLQVDAGSAGNSSERCPPERFRGDVDGEPLRRQAAHGEAGAVHRHALSHHQTRELPRSRDRQPRTVSAPPTFLEATDRLDDAGEHAATFEGGERSAPATSRAHWQLASRGPLGRATCRVSTGIRPRPCPRGARRRARCHSGGIACRATCPRGPAVTRPAAAGAAPAASARARRRTAPPLPSPSGGDGPPGDPSRHPPSDVPLPRWGSMPSSRSRRRRAQANSLLSTVRPPNITSTPGPGTSGRARMPPITRSTMPTATRVARAVCGSTARFLLWGRTTVNVPSPPAMLSRPGGACIYCRLR